MNDPGQDQPSVELERITALLEQVLLQLRAIEIRIDTLEDQVEMAAIADVHGTLEDVRAEVRSIKDEML